MFDWLVFYGFGVYLVCVFVCCLLRFIDDGVLLLLIRPEWLFVRW